ncbi:hypothetical protein COU74_03245 [Candidatus Peregrinibacteria bacterium CG10_big_fil_rev_8_21_14_0_10_36_19]|nr:MAG: hypothetical protein COU74_03245 [Candidatus Peregrinibacteria bacterium CG10_big_fil_rev_8_21_14_0_10_36_19]
MAKDILNFDGVRVEIAEKRRLEEERADLELRNKIDALIAESRKTFDPFLEAAQNGLVQNILVDAPVLQDGELPNPAFLKAKRDAEKDRGRFESLNANWNILSEWLSKQLSAGVTEGTITAEGGTVRVHDARVYSMFNRMVRNPEWHGFGSRVPTEIPNQPKLFENETMLGVIAARAGWRVDFYSRETSSYSMTTRGDSYSTEWFAKFTPLEEDGE